MNVQVRLPDNAWRSVRSDGSWLKATLALNGVGLHLDALEVLADKSGIQRGSGEAEATLSAIHERVGASGPFETLAIGGRDYVVVASPFCA